MVQFFTGQVTSCRGGGGRSGTVGGRSKEAPVIQSLPVLYISNTIIVTTVDWLTVGSLGRKRWVFKRLWRLK